MSKIDTTPSTVATNALGALDFTALIGGPMDAIIKAQALAAKTTYEFINEVGLTTDPDTGEKKPVNVTFQYNNNGQVATLTVPLLVILTVPNIEVSSFVIDFIANISASSSSTEETSVDTDLGIEAEAEASLKVGPFSLKIRAKANYSSKQHSKAAQESKYSVEYTMNVNVQGGQADMPAGLQTVLNILQGSSSSVGRDDMVVFTPAFIDMDGTEISYLTVTVRDRAGYFAAGTAVTLNIPGSPFSNVEVTKGTTAENTTNAVSMFNKGVSLTTLGASNMAVDKRILKGYNRRFGHKLNSFATLTDANGNVTEITGVTDANGQLTFKFTLSNEVVDDTQGNIILTAFVPVSDKEGEGATDDMVYTVPYTILIGSEQQGGLTMTPDVNKIDLDSSGTKTQTVNITLKDEEGNEVPQESIIFGITGNGAADTFTSISGNETTDANGKASFTVTLSSNPTAGSYKLQVQNDSAPNVIIPITVQV